MRRISALPHRSGAESPMAPNIRASAAVWNGPGPSFRAGSREKRLGCLSQASLYSKVAPSLFLRTRAHKRPTRCGTPPRSTYTKTTLSIISSQVCLFPRPGDPLRQMLFFQLEAHRVIPRVGEVSEPIRDAQPEQDDGIVSNRDARLALFDLHQGRPADGRARGGNFRGNASPPPCILYIVTELAQGARDG